MKRPGIMRRRADIIPPPLPEPRTAEERRLQHDRTRRATDPRTIPGVGLLGPDARPYGGASRTAPTPDPDTADTDPPEDE